MPSTFTRMNPYLEVRIGFRMSTVSLITHMEGVLQRSLPPSYYAQSELSILVGVLQAVH